MFLYKKEKHEVHTLLYIYIIYITLLFTLQHFPEAFRQADVLH